MDNLVTIPITSMKIKGSIARIEICFKVENKKFYWYFSVDMNKVRYIDPKHIVLPVEFIDKFKEKLKHHSFNLVRYKANFHPDQIKIEHHFIKDEPLLLASTDVQIYDDDYLGLSPCYSKTIKSGYTFIKKKGMIFKGNSVEVIK